MILMIILSLIQFNAYAYGDELIIDMTNESFEENHAKHWTIETFHRAIKQVCNAGKCMVRNTQGQINHFFCVLRAFSFLERQVIQNKLSNWYSLAKNIYYSVIKKFITDHLNSFVTA